MLVEANTLFMLCRFNFDSSCSRLWIWKPTDGEVYCWG